jgi:histidinol-phosphate aminotransferase
MFNLEKIVRKNILELKNYSSARDNYNGKEGVFLDANENPSGRLNRYPDTHQSLLKEKISLLKNIQSQNIFLGNGSNEIIDLVYRIFCEPGKSAALTFTPTYGIYETAAAINNVELISVPLGNSFQPDKAALSQALTNNLLKLIFICSPNNPTGNCIDDITFLAEHFDGIVVVDEAYIDFSANPSWIKKIHKYPNLIVLQTFSKAWGLAAARVGMAFAHKDIIKLLNKVKPPYNISTLNQKAVLTALSDTNAFHRRVNSILTERGRLLKKLKRFSFIKEVYPSEANFVLIKVDDANGCYNYLVNQKIIVRNRNSIINGCLRLTVGTRIENGILLRAFQNYANEKSTIY